ncbi:MAG: prepilin peptidase [Verrucomicrobiae bacterium]|nr:prepilin peptidase [Verrucomicrobiae bacterium]
MTPDELLHSWILTAFLFVFGTCIGSFLNVVIYRLPREDMTLNNPARSVCTTSGKMIPWHDNIPILSFLILGGKSRFDGKPISWRYPLVEALTGLLFALLWTVHRDVWLVALIYMGITSALIAASFIDLDHYIIPDEISIGMIVLGIALSWACPTLQGVGDRGTAFGWSALAALIGYGVFFMIGVLGRLAFKKDAMGIGDMKLMAGVGAFLGIKAIFFALILSSFLGAAVGMTLIAMKKADKGARIPYGPYLAIGTVCWMLFGERVWDWYMRVTFDGLEQPAMLLWHGWVARLF